MEGKCSGGYYLNASSKGDEDDEDDNGITIEIFVTAVI
jgi:hypothetical protein